MTTHRFFLSPNSFDDKTVIFPPDISLQISKVLRLRIDDTVVVLDGTLDEYEVRLTSVDRNNVKGEVIAVNKNDSEPSREVVLYQALLPKDKFELVLQKGTEVGVSAFVPLETKRSVVQSDYVVNKKERWQKIIQEASEQSERGLVPPLEDPLKFAQALDEAIQKGVVVLAWEREGGVDFNNVLQQLQEATPVSIFIGPEGGFEEGEVALAKEKGVLLVNFGKRILRSETAGIVIPALFLHL
jgi:16S rRNA (uracil1498-N3)-methyltransferase